MSNTMSYDTMSHDDIVTFFINKGENNLRKIGQPSKIITTSNILLKFVHYIQDDIGISGDQQG